MSGPFRGYADRSPMIYGTGYPTATEEPSARNLPMSITATHRFQKHFYRDGKPNSAPIPTPGRTAFLWLVATAFLSGCFSTSLPAIPNPPDLPRLVDAAEVQMPLYLLTPVENDRLGFQYLLGIIPFARVYDYHLEQLLRSSLTAQAGFNRFGLLTPTTNAGMAVPRLMVTVTSASVQGWDLLVIRRPSASITLSGEYHPQRGVVRACEVTGNHSKLSPFAFESDLNEVLQGASTQAAHALIECLGLNTDPLESDSKPRE